MLDMKGVIVMAGLLSGALAALFKENEDIVSNAKRMAGVAACRIHRRETATNLATGEKVYRWQIEFTTEEDLQAFDNALRNVIDAATGWEEK